ncbi:cyclin-L1-1-like isoform X2 [Papaver somniferum]|uniref:cyclin-L1-1-like isoform X2 n=1 Tax=Papaver somniferum TaxID=3469 RepID=UPI000E6FE442|nr:cyclin-L1-1-like isoform X2 [Papaver somniferum]
MIFTAIDTFYLTDEQLKNSPSRKDGVNESTENTLRIYGCDLIQEGGILLKLPQVVMATGQVLFHRFYFYVQHYVSDLKVKLSRVGLCMLLLVDSSFLSPRTLHGGKHLMLKSRGLMKFVESSHIYTAGPKHSNIPVCKTGDSSTPSNKSWDTQAQQIPKEGSANGPAAGSTVKGESALASNMESGGSKDLLVKVSLDKMKEKGDDDVNSAPHEGKTSLKPKVEQRIEGSGERSRERERERIKPRDSDRGRDFDREREREKGERESRDKLKERSRRSKDRGGYTEKSRHHSSRNRGDYHSSSYSSRDKDRHRHHPYA